MWTHILRPITHSLLGKSYMTQAFILKYVLTSDGKPNVFVHDMNKHKYISSHLCKSKLSFFFSTDTFFFYGFTYNKSGDANKTRLTMFYKSSNRAERKHIFKTNMRLKYYGICIWNS